MKKQSVLLAAVSILLLSSCQKSADEIAPSSSSAISEITGMEGNGNNNNKCNGDQKPQGPPPPEKVMADLDVNQDGAISVEEAKGPLVNDFAKIDANADGLISLEELKAGSPPPPVK